MTLENLRRRVWRARKSVPPRMMDAASRHLHYAADEFVMGKTYSVNTPEDARHFAESVYAVLEMLWKTRTELAKLKGTT